MSLEKVVIVGAGLAGASCAWTLRGSGFDGRIYLVGEEAEPPYDRPPLSKEYLRGEKAREDLLLKPLAWYEENAVELLLGTRVVGLDLAWRRVTLEGGSSLAYDALLLATGGRKRRLRVPGSELEGVFDLRTLADAEGLRALARPGRRVALVGMGFIGSEVAASLRSLGVEVAAVEYFPVPLYRVLGEEVGRVIAEVHREKGVELVLGEAVTAFEGSKRVQGVRTASGRVLECDVAVVGVGIAPAAELAEEAGLPVEDGILVDAACRTLAPGVYAAGDVARHEHPLFGRIRVEHWQNALKQGEVVARAMLGSASPYDDVHWFWSDQYELNIQYAGYQTRWEKLVFRGSLEERRFVGFYLDGGVVRAAVAFNMGRELRRAMELIRRRVPVTEGVLQDPGVDLRALAEGG